MLILLATAAGGATSAQESSNAKPSGIETTGDKVCISQQAANDCFDCFKERQAIKTALTESLANGKISEKEAARLQKLVDDLEKNHTLTVAEHKKETDALRRIIARLEKKQISLFWGLIKFRW